MRVVLNSWRFPYFSLSSRAKQTSWATHLSAQVQRQLCLYVGWVGPLALLTMLRHRWL